MQTSLRERKANGEKISMLTAYDYPMARFLDEAGIDMILVGDSLGMVVLGLPDTTGVTLEIMLHHAAAVRRAVKKATVIVDLPYQTYETPEQALENAKRLVANGADAVKMEGGVPIIPQVRAITNAGISYVGHIGMLPQQVVVEGGYKKKGKTAETAAQLLEDALALEEAGASLIVIESTVADVAARISAALKIPTVGIGAGPDCDGQVLVTPDLLGAYPWFKPSFATSRADLASEITRATREYIAAVKL